MQVLRQPAAGPDPAVDYQVLTVRRKAVAGSMDRVMNEVGDWSAPLGAGVLLTGNYGFRLERSLAHACGRAT
jgi:hypothetical protein